jgi:hypothetical protein
MVQKPVLDKGKRSAVLLPRFEKCWLALAEIVFRSEYKLAYRGL